MINSPQKNTDNKTENEDTEPTDSSLNNDDTIEQIPDDRSVSKEDKNKTALYLFLTILLIIMIFLILKLEK